MANRLNQKLRKPAQDKTRYIPPAVRYPSRRRMGN